MPYNKPVLDNFRKSLLSWVYTFTLIKNELNIRQRRNFVRKLVSLATAA